MSLDAIKEQILKLSEPEQDELRAWLLGQEWDDWDRQMAEDFAPGGRGTHLMEEARRDFHAGRTTSLAKGLREVRAKAK